MTQSLPNEWTPKSDHEERKLYFTLAGWSSMGVFTKCIDRNTKQNTVLSTAIMDVQVAWSPHPNYTHTASYWRFKKKPNQHTQNTLRWTHQGSNSV